jgi:hypothetical protein
MFHSWKAKQGWDLAINLRTPKIDHRHIYSLCPWPFLSLYLEVCLSLTHSLTLSLSWARGEQGVKITKKNHGCCRNWTLDFRVRYKCLPIKPRRLLGMTCVIIGSRHECPEEGTAPLHFCTSVIHADSRQRVIRYYTHRCITLSAFI